MCSRDTAGTVTVLYLSNLDDAGVRVSCLPHWTGCFLNVGMIPPAWELLEGWDHTLFPCPPLPLDWGHLEDRDFEFSMRV